MYLIDLDPKYRANTLLFTCPSCVDGAGRGHRIRLDSRWTVKGLFENMTVLPSIDTSCCHFFVTNGEIVNLERKTNKNG